eukprot:832362-Prymnesium_polylepis.3
MLERTVVVAMRPNHRVQAPRRPFGARQGGGAAAAWVREQVEEVVHPRHKEVGDAAEEGVARRMLWEGCGAHVNGRLVEPQPLLAVRKVAAPFRQFGFQSMLCVLAAREQSHVSGQEFDALEVVVGGLRDHKGVKLGPQIRARYRHLRLGWRRMGRGV